MSLGTRCLSCACVGAGRKRPSASSSRFYTVVVLLSEKNITDNDEDTSSEQGARNGRSAHRDSAFVLVEAEAARSQIVVRGWTRDRRRQPESPFNLLPPAKHRSC